MEALFLDVGFGTSNVILIGSGAAIVIDTGDNESQQTVAALRQFSVNRVEHLVISHWHDDHVGGGTAILRAFTGRVGKVWFPADRAFCATQFWAELESHTKRGTLQQTDIEALMIQGTSTRTVWSDPARNARLEIVSPCHMEMMKGIATGDSNATSGILALWVGSKAIVFGGDAVLAQWHSMWKRLGGGIDAEVLAVPHHAGVIWPSHWNETKINGALDTLYGQVVKARAAVISTGTRPGRHHPRADVIRALRRAHVKVLCTQLTKRCTSNIEQARTLQASLVTRSAKGRSVAIPLKTANGHSNHVACAGSVMVEISIAGAMIHQLNTHNTFIGMIPRSKNTAPICQ